MEPRKTRSEREKAAYDALRGSIERVGEAVLVSTGVGTGFGVVLGYMRSQNVAMTAMGVGLNYTLFSSLFFGSREVLMYVDPSVPRRNSTLAGSITGGLLTTLYAGVRKGMLGAVAWGAVGLCGQLMVEEITARQERQREAALKRRKERLGVVSDDDTNATVDSVIPHNSTAQQIIGREEENTSDLGGGKLTDFLPSWSPFQLLSEEEYERRLEKRLEHIRLALARDDAYRRMMEEEIRKYDTHRQQRRG